MAAADVDRLEAGAEAEESAGRRQSAKQKVLCSITISSSCDPVCCPSKCYKLFVTKVSDKWALAGLLDSNHAQEYVILDCYPDSQHCNCEASQMTGKTGVRQDMLIDMTCCFCGICFLVKCKLG